MSARFTYTLGGVLVAIVVLMLVFKESKDAPNREAESVSAPREKKLSPSSEANVPRPSPTRPAREKASSDPEPLVADPEVIELYQSPEYGRSDLEEFYASRGIDNYPELMLGALKGDADDLGEVFGLPPTDGAATESYQVGVETLIQQLGDRYFAFHLAKQPEEVQRRIVWLLWGAKLSEATIDNIPGGAPLAGNGAEYPETGEILMSVFSAEEIEEWQGEN
ncbi:hypothetical protein [Haloferula sp.]|uniref:hypothetical protein n=1 Tax=Haloferula sp. TaxID=2497595 RepID=UPI003C78C209